MLLRLSDGSSRDVTSETNWQTRTPQVLSLESSGVYRALQAGDGTIYGFYRAEGALNAMKEVIVVPSGTYRLTGVVSEVGFPTSPVRDARVDVASSSNGPSTTTGDDGRYRL